MNTTNKTPNWYLRMITQFDELMEKLGIPENIANELQTFVTTIAKEQYRVGNKSGIAWLLKQQKQGAANPAT